MLRKRVRRRRRTARISRGWIRRGADVPYILGLEVAVDVVLVGLALEQVGGADPVPDRHRAREPQLVAQRRDLRVEFTSDAGMFRAVDGLTFDVPRGRTVALVATERISLNPRPIRPRRVTPSFLPVKKTTFNAARSSAPGPSS